MIIHNIQSVVLFLLFLLHCVFVFVFGMCGSECSYCLFNTIIIKNKYKESGKHNSLFRPCYPFYGDASYPSYPSYLSYQLNHLP